MAAPPAVMQYDGATGWLVGEEHGGLAAMFTMMNNARLGVGVHALGAGEAAYQHALAYAMDRVQGRAPVSGRHGGRSSTTPMCGRMLTGMKAGYSSPPARSRSIWRSPSTWPPPTGEPAWIARAAFLTPIAKNFGAETGMAVADAGIQVHGGMGFIEETGAAQFARDVRVSAIYEGTTGIQGADLVGAQAVGRRGCGLRATGRGGADGGGRGRCAAGGPPSRRCGKRTRALLEMEINDRLAGSVPYARAFALTLGGALPCAGRDG